MAAYEPSEWTDLFVATAGATAALAGLVFVAVSINIERILKLPGLPERALETVLLLLSVVVVSVIGLIPGQSTTALGVELLAVALVATAAITALMIRSLPPQGSPRAWLLGRTTVLVLATVPFVVGAASLVAEAGGGLYWTVGGIIAAIAGGVANAWVLLVEILR